IGVADAAEAGISREHAGKTLARLIAPVGDDHHAGVQTIADSYTAAVMETYPMRAGSRIEQRVENRPIGYGIAAVAHRFRFTIRRRDAARIEMVAPDDDRCAHDAAAHELVERKPRLRAVAVFQPADSR